MGRRSDRQPSPAQSAAGGATAGGGSPTPGGASPLGGAEAPGVAGVRGVVGAPGSATGLGVADDGGGRPVGAGPGRGAGALGWAAVVLMAAALYLIFVWVPNERTMGVVSRIFYFHVASAWNAFLAFFVTFAAGAVYLWQRRWEWDLLAAASAEIGVLFTTIVLVTGPLWARPVWNVWWTWDPRLTTTLVLWFLYVGYLVLRQAVEGEERRARLAAVYGIVAFFDVPVVFQSVRWWRTIHPQVLGPGELRVAPEMLLTLAVSVLAFTALYGLLLRLAVRVAGAERAAWRLKGQLRAR